MYFLGYTKVHSGYSERYHLRANPPKFKSKSPQTRIIFIYQIGIHNELTHAAGRSRAAAGTEATSTQHGQRERGALGASESVRDRCE